MNVDFENIFHQWVEKNQKYWSHDRNLTVGASEIEACTRKIFFDKRGREFGFEIDEDHEESWGAMERGNIIENHWVVPAVNWFFNEKDKSKILITHTGEDQETMIYKNNSSTPDGLIINAPPSLLSQYGIDDIEGDCVCFEIKSIDPRSNIEEEKRAHHWQTQQQMGIFRETTEYKPNYAVIFYVNASWFDSMEVFVVKFEQDKWDQCVKKADMVYSAEDPIKVPAQGIWNNGCSYCKWTHACAKIREAEVPKKKKYTASLEEETDLYNLAWNLQDVKEEIEKLDKEKKEYADELTRIIRSVDANTLVADDLQVNLAWSKGKESLNAKRLAEAVDLKNEEMIAAGIEPIDVQDFVTRGVGHSRLSVTKKKSPKTKQEK